VEPVPALAAVPWALPSPTQPESCRIRLPGFLPRQSQRPPRACPCRPPLPRCRQAQGSMVWVRYHRLRLRCRQELFLPLQVECRPRRVCSRQAAFRSPAAVFRRLPVYFRRELAPAVAVVLRRLLVCFRRAACPGQAAVFPHLPLWFLAGRWLTQPRFLRSRRPSCPALRVGLWAAHLPSRRRWCRRLRWSIAPRRFRRPRL
jgi:hypothetical protein